MPTIKNKTNIGKNRANTIADISVSYAIHLASNLEIHQALKPNIKRWSENLFEREAFKKAISLK